MIVAVTSGANTTVSGDFDEETGPRHINPAGDIASPFENGEINAELGDDSDREELGAFIKRAEAGVSTSRHPLHRRARTRRRSA